MRVGYKYTGEQKYPSRLAAIRIVPKNKLTEYCMERHAIYKILTILKTYLVKDILTCKIIMKNSSKFLTFVFSKIFGYFNFRGWR